MTVRIYARCSTDEQTVQSQRHELNNHFAGYAPTTVQELRLALGQA